MMSGQAWHERLAVAHHGEDGAEQLAQSGDQGDLGQLAAADQAIVEGLEPRIATYGREQRHPQGSPQAGVADRAEAGPLTAAFARLLGKPGALPGELGEVETLLADTGYFSEANVQACVAAEVDPLIAMGRQPHHPPLAERFARTAGGKPTPVEAMAHRLKTPEGRALYALRKHTPEPVFGIIKSVLGFRQFLLRGLNKVRGEWNLVTMAYNVKRLFALAGAA